MQSATNSAAPVQSEGERQPWEQVEGESKLWHNRFLRFLQLGFNRTVLLALEQERREFQLKVQAPKGTENEASTQKRGQNEGKSWVKNQPFEVLKPAPVQVPGSWKRASVRFQWVERAHAWDSYQVELMVEKHLRSFQEGLATSIGRVEKLKNMHFHLENVYNDNVATMSFTEICVCQARLQSLLKDIRDEMSHFDVAVARVLLRKQCQDFYEKDLSQVPFLDVDALLAQIAEEEARRAAQAIQ